MIDRLMTPVLALTGETRRWLASTAPTILLGLGWVAAYLGGGSRTALAHLLYLPILLAAATMGARGGALAGLVAAVLAGPLLPYDVATGTPQEVLTWVTRGGAFVGVGTLAGLGVEATRRRYEAAIERSLHAELDQNRGAGGTISRATTVELRRLLDTRAFHVVFQPIRRLDDSSVVAVEALTRFHSEPYQPPDVWFDRAATVGLAVDLELTTAATALEAADTGLPPELVVSINVSPATLLDQRLLRLLERHPDRSVILEVTEHAIVEDYLELERALTTIRRRGARLAVDDAGAGFSSLRHIVRLAPEVIKLDLSLTQGLGADPVRAALADCLVDFARRTGTLLVAEGIEQPGDLSLWRSLGADAAQGYLLGRPAPLPQVLQPLAHLG